MGYFDRVMVTLNGVRQDDVEMAFLDLTVSGGAGIVGVYLTTDGLVKSGSNSFRFTNVLFGWSSSNPSGSMPTISESGIAGPFYYDSATGLAQWRILESNETTVLILNTQVTGNEAKENGYAARVGYLATF